MPSDESTLVVFDRLSYQAVCKSVFNKLSVSVPTTAQHTINLGYFQAFDITLMPANLTELEYLQVQEAAFDRLVQMSNETGDLDLTNIELELAVDRLVDDMIDELDQIVEILRPEEPDHSYRQRLINEIHRQERISHILITLYITLFIYTSTPLFK